MSLKLVRNAGVPSIRSETSCHGQGPIPITVPTHFASSVLHPAISNMRDENGGEVYEERGQKVVFGPAMEGDGSTVVPREERGQGGCSARQSDRRIPPKSA
jgi:hypothetical protein